MRPSRYGAAVRDIDRFARMIVRSLWRIERYLALSVSRLRAEVVSKELDLLDEERMKDEEELQ